MSMNPMNETAPHGNQDVTQPPVRAHEKYNFYLDKFWNEPMHRVLLQQKVTSTNSSDKPESQNTTDSNGGPVQVLNPASTPISLLVHMINQYNNPLDASTYSAYIRRLRTLSALPDLVDALISQYNAPAPPFILHEDLKEWNRSAKILIRLRVMHFITTWIEYHWLPGVDDVVFSALKALIYQATAELAPLLGHQAQKIVHARIHSMQKGINRRRGLIHSVHVVAMLMEQVPNAVITNETLLLSLQNKEYDKLDILDFDPVQLARQLTIMESDLYCAIRPEDMLQEDFGLSSNVRAINTFSTRITNWVSERILNEVQSENRRKIIEFMLDVAELCLQLYNFSTSSSILAAFETPIISRLSQTFSTLRESAKDQLESLKRLMDPSEDHTTYRKIIRATVPPAVPCLGLYLADATFCRESYRGSDPDSRNKLIHFKKYSMFSQIIREMQRFQTPYRLTVMPEIQDYLQTALNKTKVANPPSLPQTPDITFTLKSVTSFSTTSNTISLYSTASSRTVSTDYGFYYTRHAISEELLDVEVAS